MAKKPPRKPAKASSGRKTVAAARTSARKPAARGKTPAPAKSGVVQSKRAPKSETKARPEGKPTRIVPPPEAPVTHPEDNGSRKPVERALTRQELEQFRELLLQKRAEILGDVSTLHNEALNKDRREAAGDLSSMPIHMADLGSDNYELEFTLGLIEGERAILKEIDEALERMQHGTYGICVATGKPIGRARLKAKPWAKYCYEYTLAQEQGRHRRF